MSRNSGSSRLLEPCGPVQARNGIALHKTEGFFNTFYSKLRVFCYSLTAVCVTRSAVRRYVWHLLSAHGHGKGGHHLILNTIGNVSAFPRGPVRNNKKTYFRIIGIHASTRLQSGTCRTQIRKRTLQLTWSVKTATLALKWCKSPIKDRRYSTSSSNSLRLRHNLKSDQPVDYLTLSSLRFTRTVSENSLSNNNKTHCVYLTKQNNLRCLKYIIASNHENDMTHITVSKTRSFSKVPEGGTYSYHCAVTLERQKRHTILVQTAINSRQRKMFVLCICCRVRAHDLHCNIFFA